MRFVRRSALLAAALALSAGVLPAAASAESFDGSKPLLCTTVEARDCAAGLPCHHGLAQEIGAPVFLRIDVGQRTIVGDRRTTRIAAVDTDDARVLLQGTELGYGWSVAIDRRSGRFSGALTDAEGVFVLLGVCTVP